MYSVMLCLLKEGVVTTSQITCEVVDQTKQPIICLPWEQLGDRPTQLGQYQDEIKIGQQQLAGRRKAGPAAAEQQ